MELSKNIKMTRSKTEEKQTNRINNQSIKEQIRQAILDNIPKEKKRDTMSVVKDNISFMWRPNNYRLKIKIKKCLNTTLKSGVRMQLKKRIKFKNHNSKIIIKNYYQTTIMIDKNSMTIIHTPKKRVWYKVRVVSIEEMNRYVDNKVLEIEEKCLKAAVLFSRLFTRFSLFIDKREWIRHEDAVKGEEFIDSIPDDLIMHDTYFKKVYAEEVEFKSPTYMKNYMANRTIESVTPQIVSRLEKIEDELKSLSYTRFIEEEEQYEKKKKVKPDYIG